MGWRMIAVLAIGSLAMQAGLALAQADPDLAAARSANLAARASVNPGSAAEHVPGYTAAPGEAALYGRTDLKALAAERLAQCAAPGGDAVCQGQIGAMQSAQGPRDPLGATDPAAAGARAIMRDPAANQPGLAVLYEGCPAGAVCSPDQFCVGAQCFDTSHANDADFAQAMTFMEAAREAGVYLDQKSMHVFNGEGNSCRNRLLKNCCYADGAGANFSNRSLFGIGSRLVYDILMNAGNREFITQGAHALLVSGGFSGSFTTFGVTVAINGTALPAGSVTLATTEHLAIAYSPWSLALTAVMYVAISMMSCSTDEGKLAMKEGASLCHTIGTWCSSCIRVLGHCVSCIERSTGKCCFNSRLARMINEQGRAQLGLGWGSPQKPACAGFTVAQLQALDFSRFDLTEFYASIVPSLPDVAAWQAVAAKRAAGCGAGRGKC